MTPCYSICFRKNSGLHIVIARWHYTHFHHVTSSYPFFCTFKGFFITSSYFKLFVTFDEPSDSRCNSWLKQGISRHRTGYNQIKIQQSEMHTLNIPICYKYYAYKLQLPFLRNSTNALEQLVLTFCQLPWFFTRQSILKKNVRSHFIDYSIKHILWQLIHNIWRKVAGNLSHSNNEGTEWGSVWTSEVILKPMIGKMH